MYVFVCFLTIFIASRADLMYENITGVALIPQYHLPVILFTIFLAFFFAYKMHYVYHTLTNDSKYYHLAINITAFAMGIGSLFTYTINSQDIYSLLHVYLSMLSCLSFLILLFIYTRYLSIENPMMYNQIHWFYDLGIQFLALLTIVMTRVNGYIEILFSFIVCIYLYMIENYNKKEPFQ